jgi:hypothetical protein
MNDSLNCYDEAYQYLQSNFDYDRKLILLSNESVKLPSFPDLVLDLSKVFLE